jgi:galactonate dehydratase
MEVDKANLEIAALHAWALREPESHRVYTVIRLTAKSGAKGYGECGEVSTADIEAARKVVVGRPATAIQGVQLALKNVPRVIGGLDVAMLDLIGKAAKAPLYQILGGPTRNKALALVALHGKTDDDLTASAKTLRASGFRAFMVPLPPALVRNQGQAFAQTVQHRLDAVLEATDHCDVVLDGAAALTPGDARTLAGMLEPSHMLWFDEPCPMSNLPALRKISDECVTPLGFGRHFEQPGEVLDALRAEVIDIVRPDIARHGISQIRRMAALAESYYVAVGPNHHGGPIGTAAALHLAASIPNFFIQQIPVPESDVDRRMRAELTGGSIEGVKDGFASLPTGPGLGINVSDEALDKYKEWTI